MKSYEEAKERIPSQLEKILNRLKKAGEEGVTNSELSRISLQYSARLMELRLKGYVIETIPLKNGVYKYILRKMSSEIYYTNATDDILMTIKHDYDNAISSEELKALLIEKYFNIQRKSGWFKQNTLLH